MISKAYILVRQAFNVSLDNLNMINNYFVYFSIAPSNCSVLIRSFPANFNFSASSFSDSVGGAFFLS